jgi:hypothetical protein
VKSIDFLEGVMAVERVKKKILIIVIVLDNY